MANGRPERRYPTPPTLQEQTDAARAYEALFVPSLLGQFAPVVSDVAKLQSGDRVLDVACGTGVLAREAAARTTPGGSVVGLDPNPGMLSVAAELAPALEWRLGLAESLPFPDGSFDAVVSQFGLMFFSDRRTALREMLRVLRPGGRLAIAVWDSLDHTPAYAAEVALLERVAGRPAADALRAPFVLGDRQLLATLFTEAGMPGARIATVPGTAEFPSVRTLVEADLRGWLPVMGVTLSEPTIARILEEAEALLRDCVTPEGTARFASPAHVVAATKP